ncbi:TlpA family protein disulfide reductase [Tsukamurella soli]|uniref:TlpA disulfide reductase family protein n=1 Tax=Tsukamurella soli TaxID=644556 RepID=A0ABP8J8A8_9ACTN
MTRPRPVRLSASAKWVIVCAVVLVALVVAIRPQHPGGADQAPSAPTGTVASAPGELAAARSRARLQPCTPDGTGTVGADSDEPAAMGPLAGLTLTCLSDGRPVDVGRALAGRPALVNIWAYWCGPCRVELPALAGFAKRAAGRVTVLTVHADPNESAALDLLTGLGVHLPTVEDPTGRVGTAAGAPRVYPTTVLVRADGSVAGVQARPFTSVDDIVGVVRAELGVDL